MVKSVRESIDLGQFRRAARDGVGEGHVAMASCEGGNMGGGGRGHWVSFKTPIRMFPIYWSLEKHVTYLSS